MDQRASKPDAGEITNTLNRFTAGDRGAADKLVQMLGSELRRLACQHMRRERDQHTLQTTGLLNETFLRLSAMSSFEWKDRKHFLAVASRIMRQVLIDYARAHSSETRGGGTLELESSGAQILPNTSNLLDVDAALVELAAIAPRQVELVELRFYGGLTLEEAADVLGISARTADKDWSLARAWLRRRLGPYR